MSDDGRKIIQVGEVQLGDYTDKLVKIVGPDGTWAWDGPGIPLQRYMRFSQTMWHEAKQTDEF